MTKRSGLGDRLLVGGRNLSGDIGSIGRVGGGPSALDVTGIDKSAFERIGGLRDGAIEFSAWFNPSPGQAHPVLKTLPTSDVLVTYLRGAALGVPAACCVAKQVNYDADRGDDGGLAFGVQALANGFGVEWGELNTDGIRTVLGGTSSTNGLDAGAASTFGFQAYLHVLDFAGTSVSIRLQESSDDGVGDVYADVTGGVFTTVTAAPFTERIAASPATLERYTRVRSSGTYTSVTFAVVLVRNQSAVKF